MNPMAHRSRSHYKRLKQHPELSKCTRGHLTSVFVYNRFFTSHFPSLAPIPYININIWILFFFVVDLLLSLTFFIRLKSESSVNKPIILYLVKTPQNLCCYPHVLICLMDFRLANDHLIHFVLLQFLLSPFSTQKSLKFIFPPPSGPLSPHIPHFDSIISFLPISTQILSPLIISTHNCSPYNLKPQINHQQVCGSTKHTY